MTSIQIECFLATVKMGSLSGAAKELFLSAQVVSQHISHLEQELSETLFQRGRGGVSLTDAGRRLYAFSAKWQGLYEQTVKSIRETYENLSLSFRIGLSEYIDSVGSISGGIADFACVHSATAISGAQYSNRSIMSEVAEGRIDVAIMCDTQIVAGGDFEVVPFAKEDLRLYISGAPELPPGLRLGDRELDELCRTLPHVNAPYGHWSTDEWLEISKRMNGFLGIPFHTTCAMPNFRSVIACIHMVPCTVVCDARFGYLRDSDGLYSVPLDTDSHLCCVWDKKNENPLLQEFAGHMARYYRSEGAPDAADA